MTTVYIRRSAYDYERLRPELFSLFAACLPPKPAGSRVVIKPNLLAPAGPDAAIVTHPLIVRAAAEYCLERDWHVQVSDSQAMGKFERVLHTSGIGAALQGLDVECAEFKDSVEIDIGEPFNRIELARAAVEADLLINLPKLKTHTHMGMTLGIKNLFGCVVGMKKPEWHLRVGVNRELFATLLVKIHAALRPAVTVIDGILAMEGQGPGRGGTPRAIGVLAAGTDTYALDTEVCRLLGVDPMSVFTNRAACDLGLLPAEIEIQGESPQVDCFKLPEITPLIFGPAGLHGFMRRHLVQRPVPDDTCRLCGECWKYCPAKAISPGRKRIIIDYARCIRCYCCIEVCPHAALHTEEPLLGKALRKFKD